MEPSFWDNSNKAQSKMRKLAGLKSEVEDWVGLDDKARSLDELLALSS